jgi:hypothetical protein
LNAGCLPNVKVALARTEQDLVDVSELCAEVRVFFVWGVV